MSNYKHRRTYTRCRSTFYHSAIFHHHFVRRQRGFFALLSSVNISTSHNTPSCDPHHSWSLWSDTWSHSLNVSGELSSSHLLWNASNHALTHVYITLPFHLLVVLTQRNLYLIVLNMDSRTTERKKERKIQGILLCLKVVSHFKNKIHLPIIPQQTELARIIIEILN